MKCKDTLMKGKIISKEYLYRVYNNQIKYLKEIFYLNKVKLCNRI